MVRSTIIKRFPVFGSYRKFCKDTYGTDLMQCCTPEFHMCNFECEQENFSWHNHNTTYVKIMSDNQNILMVC